MMLFTEQETILCLLPADVMSDPRSFPRRVYAYAYKKSARFSYHSYFPSARRTAVRIEHAKQLPQACGQYHDG